MLAARSEPRAEPPRILCRLASAEACCEACGANAKCVEWAYHAKGSAQDSQCHLHSAQATRKQQAGTTAGVMRR